MNSKQQRPLKKLLGIRGMGAALTAFVGLIIIYIAFGIINPAVFSGQNMLNLLRSMSKYLLIGIAQSYVLITGNIDLSIGSMVGMSAMIAATLMTTGMVPFLAIVIALIACLVVGVVNGYLVGKFKLPPFIATLGTMFVAYLKENEICTAFHYVPLHSSPAGRKFGRFSGEDVYTTRESERLLRLPMFYNLEMSDVEYITEKILSFEF